MKIIYLRSLSGSTELYAMQDLIMSCIAYIFIDETFVANAYHAFTINVYMYIYISIYIIYI